MPNPEFLGHTVGAWVVIAAAIAVQLLVQGVRTVVRAATCVAVAVFCAVVFTDPVMFIWGLPRDTPPDVLESVERAVSGLLALGGGALIRIILSSESLIEILRAWRGK